MLQRTFSVACCQLTTGDTYIQIPTFQKPNSSIIGIYPTSKEVEKSKKFLKITSSYITLIMPMPDFTLKRNTTVHYILPYDMCMCCDEYSQALQHNNDSPKLSEKAELVTKLEFPGQNQSL